MYNQTRIIFAVFLSSINAQRFKIDPIKCFVQWSTSIQSSAQITCNFILRNAWEIVDFWWQRNQFSMLSSVFHAVNCHTLICLIQCNPYIQFFCFRWWDFWRWDKCRWYKCCNYCWCYKCCWCCKCNENSNNSNLNEIFKLCFLSCDKAWSDYIDWRDVKACWMYCKRWRWAKYNNA